MKKTIFVVFLNILFSVIYLYAGNYFSASISGIVEYKEKNSDLWKLADTSMPKDVVYQVNEKSKIQFTIDSANIISEDYSVFSFDLKKTNYYTFTLLIGKLSIRTNETILDNFELILDNYIITNIASNSDIEFNIDVNNKVYVCVNSGYILVKNTVSQKNKSEKLTKNFYQFVDNKIISLDKSNLRFKIKNISGMENRSLRETVINRFSSNKSDNSSLNKNEPIALFNPDKSEFCRVIYFYPKANEIIKSDNPYGIVIFNSVMDIKSVEKSVFAISDGIKNITESLENLRFMGYIRLEWSNNNTILTIVPLKEKLINNKKYSMKLTTNNGKDIYGKTLQLELFEGSIIYEK